MPWSKEHKAQTRARIVREAAGAFRRSGIGGVSVNDVMSRAGLTHGGFYAHFASKDDLLQEALKYADAQTIAYLKGDAEKYSASSLDQTVERYLAPEHAAHPEQGCPIAALGPEIARAPVEVRTAFADHIRQRIRNMADMLPARLSKKAREKRATATLACMIGGVVLSRLLDERSGEALAACREFLNSANA